jgi:hypothetical protein
LPSRQQATQRLTRITPGESWPIRLDATKCLAMARTSSALVSARSKMSATSASSGSA